MQIVVGLRNERLRERVKAEKRQAQIFSSPQPPCVVSLIAVNCGWPLGTMSRPVIFLPTQERGGRAASDLLGWR